MAKLTDDELARMRETIGADAFQAGRFAEARELFEQVATDQQFVEFLTLPAYELID